MGAAIDDLTPIGCVAKMPLGAPFKAAEESGQEVGESMYNLLIKGGMVIDPSLELHQISDVAVEDGKIARVAPSIPAEEASRVIEVQGKVVTPGLIDLHTHVYHGVNGNGVEADVGGVHAGVTTMVDAGSAGCDTFGGFPSHIVPNNRTEIICFLHICWIFQKPD